MIKCEKGSVTIDGDKVIVQLDLILIINAFRKGVGAKIGEERAIEMIAECGRIAFLEDDEMHKAVANIVGESIEDQIKSMLGEVDEDDDE